MKECQLFFNTNPHPSSIDLGGNSDTFTGYSMEFDYKFSSVLFEKFTETTNGFGAYVGYDGGSMWKVGNGSRGSTQSTGRDSSRPSFFTYGQNILKQNGVDYPLIMENISEPIRSRMQQVSTLDITNATFSVPQAKESLLNMAKTVWVDNKPTTKNFIERIKDNSVRTVKRELSKLVNDRANLISRTINKIGIDFVGNKGVRPPRNVYAKDKGAVGNAFENVKNNFFYDVRNEVFNFAGGSVSDFINNITFKNDSRV